MAEQPPSPLPAPEPAQLFDEVPCGLAVTQAPSGLILRVNQTLCGWVGRPAASLVGTQKLQDLLTMGGRIFHHTHLQPMLDMQGSLSEVKLDMRHADGHRFPVMLNAIRRQHEGRAIDVVSITMAEERNQYERELLLARQRADELLLKEREAQDALRIAQSEASRLKEAAEDRANFAEQMIGIVSHDLRNPLHAILMGTSMLSSERTLAEEQRRRLVGNMMGAARRAQRMITELLDFTVERVGGGLRVEPRAVDLQAVVDGAVDELALSFPHHRIRHEKAGHGDAGADPDRIVQMVGNLVANAVTYGVPAGVVTVATSVGPQGASISVHNDGAPIPPQLLERIFEPMVRGAQAAAAARNVGLGLFIVRAIAQAHGGSVSVMSSQEHGTTFRIDLPSGGDPTKAS